MDKVTETELDATTLEVMSDANHQLVIMRDDDGCLWVWTAEYARELGVTLIRRADLAEGLPPRATLNLIKTA
jgi:hypothetical protein